VCATGTARQDDLLCPECSYAFTLMLELLHGHPDVEIKDIERIRRVFEWRMRKMGLAPTQPEAIEEEKKLSSALSLRSRQGLDAR
jgi:hypothetical protein